MQVHLKRFMNLAKEETSRCILLHFHYHLSSRRLLQTKELMIMINPNSKDEAEAFQSLLVSVKGITENARYV